MEAASIPRAQIHRVLDLVRDLKVEYPIVVFRWKIKVHRATHCLLRTDMVFDGSPDVVRPVAHLVREDVATEAFARTSRSSSRKRFSRVSVSDRNFALCSSSVPLVDTLSVGFIETTSRCLSCGDPGVLKQGPMGTSYCEETT